MIRLALLACALAASSVQAEWLDAVEVPWADRSDFRISYYHGYQLKAQFICVDEAYDFLLMDVELTKPLRLFASMPRVEKARYRVDDGEWRELLYARYYSAGSDIHRSHVAFPFTGAPITRFMEGRKAEFVVLDTEGNTHRQTVSLIGFTRAFNSLPQLDDCK